MKTSGSGRVIGGRSLWGELFDMVLAKYHWTLDYLLWGISYMNVHMMLSDSVAFYANSVSLKESNATINADDLKNKELLRQMIDD